VGLARPPVALADAVLKALLVARVKAAAVVTAAVLMVVGVGLGAYRAVAPPPLTPRQDGVAREAGGEPEAPATGGRRSTGVAPAHDWRGKLEAPLPPGALHRLGTTRLRQGGPVEALAFSPDSSKVLSCGGPPDGTLRLWDRTTGKELWRHPLPRPARAVATSRNGKLLAVGADDGVVRLCELATGKEVRRLRGHEKGVWAVAFTPDGKTVISGSLDCSVRLWDCATGKEKLRLRTAGQAVRALALSFDGKLLAAGCEEPGPRPASHPVRLWDLPSGRERRSPVWQNGPVRALTFSHKGDRLACAGMDGSLVLWDVAAGWTRRELQPLLWKHRAAFPLFQSLAFSPDGKTLACGSSDNSIYLVDPGTGESTARLDGALLGQSPVEQAPTQWPRVGGILALAYAPDGKTLAAGQGQAVRLWDMPTAVEKSFGGHRGGVCSVVFSPDGQVLASAGWDFTVRLWDARTGHHLCLLFEPPHGFRPPGVPQLAFSPDGRTVAISIDPAILLVEATTGRRRWVVRSSGQETPAFSADGKSLVLLNAGTRKVRVLDVADGRQVRSATAVPAGTVLAMTAAGKVLSGADTRPAPDRAASPLHAQAFSPEGKLGVGAVRSGAGAVLLVWSTAQAGPPRLLPGHEKGRITALAVAPGSRLLASGGEDRGVRLWDPGTLQQVKSFPAGHQADVSCLAFSPDGKRLASGSADGTVLLWKTAAP
jgi:WD40 repeat protein